MYKLDYGQEEAEALWGADPRRYAVLVLANVFGGGMSSRLFQRVREELGLASAEAISLLRYDPARNELVFAATETLRESTVTGVSATHQRGLAAWVARTSPSIPRTPAMSTAPAIMARLPNTT